MDAKNRDEHKLERSCYFVDKPFPATAEERCSDCLKCTEASFWSHAYDKLIINFISW